MKSPAIIAILAAALLMLQPTYAAMKGLVFGRPPSGNYPTVSPAALIVEPERYHGKPLQTDGYLFVGDREILLFAWKEDLEHSRANHAFALGFNGDVKLSREELGKLNGKRIMLSGVFLGSENGKVRPFGGLIHKIEYLEDAEPERQ